MKIGLLIIFFCIFFACKRDAVPDYNTVIEYDTSAITVLDAPNSLKSMFPFLPKNGGKEINVKTYSNNGLTESMSISQKSIELGYTSKPKSNGGDISYEMINYQYKSSLYGFNFIISEGYLWSINYCFGFNYNPGFGYTAPWVIDSAFWGLGAPNFMLRFVADSGVNNRLSFPVSDHVSRSLSICNDCFTDLGTYSVRNKTYNQVYKFKNDIQIQSANAFNPHYLWVDRDYGIIQFQLKDSTIWSFEYP